jgi:alcohol dehydrogenase class IV
MRFEFATATRIIFGRGTVRELGALCREHGRKALLVTGRNPVRVAGIVDLLAAEGMTTATISIAGEPTTQDVERGVLEARTFGADMVLGIGGGSVIDAGKGIAAMCCQKGALLDYLEVIGKGRPLEEKPLPYFAIPTTAGTGAEVTRNAVLASPEHQVKASLRHAWMLPTVALVDPELARDCPPTVTAASGMDALTQCLEAYVSCRAQPMTDALCADGIRRAVRSLERAVADGRDMAAREDMALAALFSGLALANAGLGAVHGFAAPIGGAFHAPHGAVCAALLAPVWNANWRSVQAGGDLALMAKFQDAAALLTDDTQATPERAGAFLRELTQRLVIPSLGTHGIQESDLDGIVEKASKASSMKGNPVTLSPEVLRGILLSAL